MDVKIVTITLGIAIILGCVIGILLELLSNKNKQIPKSHFSSIYKGKEFEQIVEASNKAGNFNCRFIEDDNIFNIIRAGSENLARETETFNVKTNL